MRKKFRKITTIFAAGALAVSAFSLTACDGSFTPPKGIPSGEVHSNGGFVVEVGDYYYFINGSESYTADNTYGKPVKGSLMRVTKGGLAANSAETVIPSLMTASDYSSGIYIYGDRVYYATPNNIKNTAGDVENDYLAFKSAKLDGTDVRSYMTASSNSTNYRFVQVGGQVYLMYYQDSELHSYRTSDKKDILLAKDVASYVFNRTDKEDPYVYYTMSVTMGIDEVNGSKALDFNQIYRARADVSECPYAALRDYKWNEEYLEENDDEVPYVNLGTLVLDGVGAVYRENPTIFSHDLGDNTPLTASGYSYSLQTYENGGLYFKREDLTQTGTVGEGGWLYYLAADKLENSWNSVTGNSDSYLSVVARPTDAANASASALYYVENNRHHYIYLKDNSILRADVDEAGAATVTRIAQNTGAPTLVSLDLSDSKYQYVYYTIAGNGGNYIYRAVINGEEEDYRTLGYDENEPYRPVRILNIEHAKSWYNFEIIGTYLFFADAESLGSTSYNYTSYIDLANGGSSVMDNSALKSYNEKFEETTGTDGTLSKLNSDNKTNLSNAIKYYFYTGETQQFYDNIDEAKTETGKENTLYSPEEVSEFAEYVGGGNQLRSDFVKRIGKLSQTDEDAIKDYWRLTLQHYTAPTEEESGGLPAWSWAIIGVGIGVIVIGVGVCVFLLLKKSDEDENEKEEKMFVDTTDDRSVDVYSDAAPEESSEEPSEESSEKTEEPVEETAEEPSEESSEETEEPVEETAEEPSEEAPEAPAAAPEGGEKKPEGENPEA